jgi:hypothetical protein
MNIIRNLEERPQASDLRKKASGIRRAWSESEAYLKPEV